MKTTVIEASRLNERITIQQPSITQDDIGGQQVSWETVDTVWAMVKERDGNENFVNQRRESRQKIEVTIRYRTDLTAQHRLLRGVAVLDILSIRQADKYQAYTHIVAEKRNS